MLFFAEETRVTLYKKQVAQQCVSVRTAFWVLTKTDNHKKQRADKLFLDLRNDLKSARRLGRQQHLSLSTYVTIFLSDRYKVGWAGIVQSSNFYRYSSVIIVNYTKRVAKI